MFVSHMSFLNLIGHGIAISQINLSQRWTDIIISNRKNEYFFKLFTNINFSDFLQFLTHSITFKAVKIMNLLKIFKTQ